VHSKSLLAFHTTVNTTSVVNARASECARASFPSFQIFHARPVACHLQQHGVAHGGTSTSPPAPLPAHISWWISQAPALYGFGPHTDVGLHIRVQSACVRVCTDVCVCITSVQCLYERLSTSILPFHLSQSSRMSPRRGTRQTAPLPLPFLLSLAAPWRHRGGAEARHGTSMS